jgi:competence protein ComEC
MNFSPEIFTTVINHYLPEPHASLLNGIIFGIPLKGDKVFYREIQVVGLLHIVVLSGTNINIMTALVTKITSGISKLHSYLITILFVIIFIAFVRPQAPIVRAGFMSILTFVSIITGRKTFAIYVLGISALITALIRPEWIQGVSFQLSFGATLGLILFSSKSKNEEKDQSIFSQIKNYCMEDFKTSMAAQVFTVPIIFIYFRQVSLIAPFANVFISWVIAPLMIFGFLTAFLGAIHPVLGLVFSFICYGLLSYIVWIIKTLASLPLIFFQF